MTSNEVQVSHKILSEWRATGVISSEEIVFRSGDLLVAENVLTKTRRIINPTISESATNKRILKG